VDRRWRWRWRWRWKWRWRWTEGTYAIDACCKPCHMCSMTIFVAIIWLVKKVLCYQQTE
jgi:hypothetical protein